MIDALMTLAAKERVGRVKIAVEAEQIGVGAPWENALLFWVNRVRPQNMLTLLCLLKKTCWAVQKKKQPLNELLQDMWGFFYHSLTSLSLIIFDDVLGHTAAYPLSEEDWVQKC